MPHWRHLADFDLEFLTEILQLLDAKLSVLSEDADQVEDPDMFGHLDRIEYVTGLGFAACQQYITAVMRAGKKKFGLSLGPIHRTGDPVVTIVNAAANFWKHSAEWASLADPKVEQRREETRKPLRELGVDLQGSYPLSCVLAELVTPLPFGFEVLLPMLVAWRDEWLRQKSR